MTKPFDRDIDNAHGDALEQGLLVFLTAVMASGLFIWLFLQAIRYVTL